MSAPTVRERLARGDGNASVAAQPTDAQRAAAYHARLVELKGRMNAAIGVTRRVGADAVDDPARVLLALVEIRDILTGGNP